MKPTVCFTLPWAGVTPAPWYQERCGTSSLLELFCVILSELAMLILGIESSCDEPAAAMLETSAPGIVEIRSSTVANQDDIHRAYGGIVPELASRNHVVTIAPVIERALGAAGCQLGDIEGIAVTRGPGLVGSLLVGLMFAKGLAQASGIAMVGVNHIEGHMLVLLLDNT